MRTHVKALAAIMAMAGLATAQERAVKPDIVETAYAKLKGNRAGEEREFEIARDVRMTFGWCPAGEFMMGSPATEEGRDSRDEDQAKVTLSKGFWISKTEVTQSQWAAVMGSNPLDGIGPYGQPHPETTKGPNRPIVGVSWEDAQVFMEKVNATLGNEDGGKMSLPTEAQYEYAARAGETGQYPGGNLDEVAWYDGNCGGYTKPVGTKKANAWGLHDMNGNAWEWVQDCYTVELPGGTDPLAKEIGLDRVIRGGCWIKDATHCRLATRSYRAQMASQCFSIGIRIVRHSWPVEPSKPAIALDINGRSVSKITYRETSSEQVSEKSFVQTGPKSWMSGEAVYNEVKRNESNVHLQLAAQADQRVQIDLSEMKIHFRGQGPKEVHPILSASKQLSAAAEAAIEQARLSSEASSSDKAGQGMTNSLGMKLVPIAKGTLQMGSLVRDEGYRFAERQHEVTLTRDYYLGAFEVTQAQYLKVMGHNPSNFQGDQVNNIDSSSHPVDRVSWEDAVEFCKRLSELPEERAAGRVYRLPTEAEWEYACRAGSNAPFGFGGLELVDDFGWFSSNCLGKTHPVGKKDPNAWGLHDMHGNVMEWCSDWAGDYPEGAISDPTGPTEGYSRMIRGGAWLTPAMLGKSGCRAFHFPPDTRSEYVGFRVAFSPEETPVDHAGLSQEDKAHLERLIKDNSLIVVGKLKEGEPTGSARSHDFEANQILKGNPIKIDVLFSQRTGSDTVDPSANQNPKDSLPSLSAGEYLLILQQEEVTSSFAVNVLGVSVTREKNVNHFIVRDGAKQAAWSVDSPQAAYIRNCLMRAGH